MLWNISTSPSPQRPAGSKIDSRNEPGCVRHQNSAHARTKVQLRQRPVEVIDELHSQSWHEFEDFKPDAILTLCDSAAEETCPVWFGESTQVHWGIPDPSKQEDLASQKAAFDRTIALLTQRVRALSELDVTDGREALRQSLLAIAERYPA